MPFTPKPAAEQGTLAVGERLCNLDFLDTHGRPFSLYDNQFFGWPKVICLSRSAAEAEASLGKLGHCVAIAADLSTDAGAYIGGFDNDPELRVYVHRARIPVERTEEEALTVDEKGLGM